MKKQILIKRYTQGLINSLRDEGEFSAVFRQLTEFQDLLAKQQKLSSILLSRFIPAAKKMAITEEILSKASFEGKASRFILLLLEKGRLELLSGILELTPEAWNESKGVPTFDVSSAVPLIPSQKKKLEERLRTLERRPVFIRYGQDPSLIGGLSIKKKNIVYDVSLKGQLIKINELISEG